MNEMKFSVSMCVYGGDDPAYFEEALQSVVRQTLSPEEIVLTVDGPVPQEIERVVSACGEQTAAAGIAFKVIRLERNVGHGEARRVSFENCACDLIALMDADDISLADRFEKQVSFLRSHPDVSVVGGYITEFISQTDPADVSHRAGSRWVPQNDAEIKSYMKKRCPMNQVTVMFRKKDVEEAGGYIDWYCEEDYYLWIRLALAGKNFGNIPENLVNVRVGEEMYQRRGGIRYFRSEARLQRYMLKERLISIPRYCLNVGERLVLQVLLPNRVRGWAFRKLARN